MTQEQIQQLARLTRAIHFCERHARVLTPVAPGFTVQVQELSDAVATVGLTLREQSAASRVPPVRVGELRDVLYAQLLTLHRIARVLQLDAEETGEWLVPRANGGVAYQLRVARQLASQLACRAQLFVARGAPVDCAEQLRATIALVEQAREREVAERDRRARLRRALRSALTRGAHAVVCLDVVVGTYCLEGTGRRGAVWKQWREIVPRVVAPALRRRGGQTDDGPHQARTIADGQPQ